MKSYYFFATLKAHIELSDDDFELLFEEAKYHYDFEIKSSIKVGGFLYGLKNYRTFAQEAGHPDKIVVFSERELNLMMKALEMNRNEVGLKLYERLFNVFKDLQDKTVAVNRSLNDVK